MSAVAGAWTRIGICGALACATAGGLPERAGAEPPPAAAPAAPAPAAAACGGQGESEAPALRWPAPGDVTSAFGTRGRKQHRGIDISGYRGRGVRAAAPGMVTFSDRKRGYGRVVILEHAGGLETVYAHNQDNLVWTGTRVEQGQLIADMGATGAASGPHLHFEVRVNGRAVDPLPCLPPRGD